MSLFHSGYPVLKSPMEFKSPGKVANKDDWNKLIMAAKVSNCFICIDTCTKIKALIEKSS